MNINEKKELLIEMIKNEHSEYCVDLLLNYIVSIPDEMTSTNQNETSSNF